MSLPDINDCSTCGTDENVFVAEEGGKRTYFVACQGCKVAGVSAPDRQTAISRWNSWQDRRKQSKALLRKRIHELKEENELAKKILHDTNSLLSLILKRQDLVGFDRLVRIALNRQNDIENFLYKYTDNG